MKICLYGVYRNWENIFFLEEQCCTSTENILQKLLNVFIESKLERRILSNFHNQYFWITVYTYIIRTYIQVYICMYVYCNIGRLVPYHYRTFPSPFGTKAKECNNNIVVVARLNNRLRSPLLLYSCSPTVYSDNAAQHVK